MTSKHSHLVSMLGAAIGMATVTDASFSIASRNFYMRLL
jgi:hypothetical protein